MAEKYFDTQALLGVVIRDPTILGADITGYSVTVNANYDWPESGKPFVPGYSLSMNPNTGLSVYQASSPSSGGLVLEMLTADNQYVPWYFDRMRLYTGSFSAVYLTNTRFIDGDVEFREITDFSTLSDYPNTQQYVQKGVQAVGELIITDRQTFDPYSEGFTNAPASLGVSSRASLSVNPQNITKMSQMVMRTSNQGDSQFATKDTILEIDKAGAGTTPKIGPGAEPDSIKIIAGTLNVGARAAIEISSADSISGIADVTLTGRLVVADAYTRSNSNGRILAVTSGGGVGYTQTPAMTRAWATSTVAATLASTTHGYQVGSTTGANIAMGPNQIMGRNNGAAMRISVPGGFTDIPDPVTGTDSTSKAWVEAYVAANGGGSGTFTELGSGIDLNTITTVGRYWQSENAEAAAGTNYPAPLAGYLEVVSNASQNELLQYYTTYNVSQATGGVYVRSRYTGVWGAWQVVFYDSGWQTVSLGAAWTHGTVPFQMRRVGNMIYGKGQITGTITVNSTMSVGTAPAGLVPITGGTGFSPCYTTGAFPGWVNVNSLGAISIHFKSPWTTGSGTIDFNSLRFPVD